MAKTIYVVDVDGYFLGEMYANDDDISYLHYTEIKPPNDGVKAKWDGEKWEVDVENEEPVVKPNIYERLDALESAVIEMLVRGGN